MNLADREAIDRLLDDDLTAEEFDSLLKRIEFDRQAVESLAARAILSAGLHQSLRRRRMQELAFADMDKLGPGGLLLLDGRSTGNPSDALSPEQSSTSTTPTAAELPAGSLPALTEVPAPSVLGFFGEALQFSAGWFASPRVLALVVVGSLATYFLGLMISIAVTRAYVGDRNVREQAESADHVAARIIAETDCQWQERSPRSEAGLQLGTGLARLAGGSVEIEFDDGARVRIQGPAEFSARSRGHLELARGRLWAYVPKRARGFTVTTPTAELIDLGTEFGVEVDGQGSTDLHVIQGRVEVKAMARPAVLVAGKQQVGAGQAVRVSAGGGTASPIPLDSRRFEALPNIVMRSLPAVARPGEPQPIWLGNLFDDPAGTPLAQAVATDTFCALAEVGDVGVVCVIHGGDQSTRAPGAEWLSGVHFPAGVIRITPGVTFDFSNLGWRDRLQGSIANDTYGKFNSTPDRALRTLGVGAELPGSKLEEGIGMHADSLITFDLDQIRAAGGLQGRQLQFVCDRAGMNDDETQPRSLASFHMVVLVSEAARLRTVVVNGRNLTFQERSGVWSVLSPPDEPVRADGHFFGVCVPLPPEASHLTLAVTMFDQENSMDHGAWGGARLEVVESSVP